MSDRPIFIDVDGTLTDFHNQGGNPIESRIEQVRELIAGGKQVVIWSGGGTAYAAAFAAEHGLSGAVTIGKPEFCVDDNPEIRPRFSTRVISPLEFFN